MTNKHLLPMQIFISYSRAHKFIAEVIQELLVEQNYQVWLDLEDIQGGELWEQKIKQAVENSALMLVIVTTPALVSQPISEEISIAKKSSREIIPLLMERFTDVTDALNKLELADRQAIDFVNQPKAIAQKQLLSSLSRIMTGLSQLQPYLLKLGNTNPEIRQQAVKRLGQTHSKIAVPYLLNMLSDENENVINETILALWELNDIRATTGLVEVINRYLEREYREPKTNIENIRYNSTTTSLVENAIMALGSMGDQQYVSFLTAILFIDDKRFMEWTIFIQIAAAIALGKLKNTLAVSSLIKCLDITNPNLRFAIVISLALIGDKQAAEPLLMIIEHEIKRIEQGNIDKDDLIDEEEYVGNEEMAEMLWLDLCTHYHITDPVVEHLLPDTMSVPCAAALVLGLFGDDKAFESLTKYVVIGFSKELYGARGAAIGLGYLGNEKARPILKNILQAGLDQATLSIDDKDFLEGSLRILDEQLLMK